MGKILAIKLINGEEIIAKIENAVSANGMAKLKLVKPVTIIISAESTTSGPKIGLVDYLMFSDKKEIQIDETHILYMYEPLNSIMNAYNQMFGSGLVLATSSILPFTK